MLVFITVVRKYGLRNIVQKIWRGTIIFAVLHAVAFWYLHNKCGVAGGVAGLSRQFEVRGTIWPILHNILGFPLGLISSDGAIYIVQMVLNSILWGLVLSFLIVPAFVNRHAD